MKRRSRGFTLLEVLVVLALIGILISVVGLTLPPPDAAGDPVVARLAAARRTAIRTGAPTPAPLGTDTVWFRPDGSAAPTRVVADGAIWTIDPLTGEVRRGE